MPDRHTADTAPAEVAASLERDGAVIVEGFVDADLAGDLAMDCARALGAVSFGNTPGGLPDRFFGLRTKRLHGLLAIATGFARLVEHPLALALCEHFLRPRARDFRVSTGELMAIGPGESRQMLHRDADSWLYYPQPRPEILVSVNLALTDFHEKNGATVLVPGSQRWPAERKPTGQEPVAFAEMRRGDALVYTGNVYHGGGANRTEETRVGLYWGYVPSWLQPLENHLVTNGLDAVRRAPPRVQTLLGCSAEGWEVIP